jgi:hypothetical protein
VRRNGIVRRNGGGEEGKEKNGSMKREKRNWGEKRKSENSILSELVFGQNGRVK